MSELEYETPVVAELECETPVAEVTEVPRLAEEATAMKPEAMVPQVQLRTRVR